MFVASIVVLAFATAIKLAATKIPQVGFKNKYYQVPTYTGSRVLEHNITWHFAEYVEAAWSQSIAVDNEGRIWIADKIYHQVLLVEASSRYIPWPAYYTEYAGSRGESGHFDGTRLQARFDSPMGLALSMVAGQLVIYIADTNNHCIRRLDYSIGRTATIAGYPKQPGLIDGAGLESRFRFPMSQGIDSTGRHLFVLDNGRRIRHVDLSTTVPTVVTLVAGACRAVSRWTVAETVVMRTVGCHPDWHAVDAGDTDVIQHTSSYICVGHVTSCGPRHHPALADHMSTHQQAFPGEAPALGGTASARI